MKKIVFSSQARADIRRLDSATAMRVFATLHRFAETGIGNVKRLQGNAEESRLRVGDYRVRFTEDADAIVIKRVRHRREAYR